MNGSALLAILLVEDDPADQKLIKSSLKDQRMAHDFHVVSSGEEALEFMRSCGKRKAADMPDLVLLDLNMPGIGGKEFLKQVKADEELKRIPVLVITTSDSDTDVADCYRLQAAGYVHKPGTLGELKQVMSQIDSYWFEACRLPRKEYV